MTRSTAPLFVLLFTAACATTPEPIKEPKLPPPDGWELFRRARFEELTKTNDEALRSIARKLRSPNVSTIEHDADRAARESYRRGEVDAARAAMAQLDPDNKTRRIIEALLSRVDTSRPMRESDYTERVLELPLVARDLDRGYPVIEAEIDRVRVHLLWDTGATENVLSPDTVDALGLTRSDVLIRQMRRDDGLVVRFGATATKELAVGPWRVFNTPWLVTELDRVDGLKRDVDDIDGFLSPQLLIPAGCFTVDRLRAILTIGFGPGACDQIMSISTLRVPLFAWDGEMFVSARVDRSPQLAVQLETGSPVTFLRAHATRYLPKGLLEVGDTPDEGEIAYDMAHAVSVQVAGRAKSIGTIDLQPNREGEVHDDVATLGNDLLLQGRGFAVSFASMEMATLESRDVPLR